MSPEVLTEKKDAMQLPAIAQLDLPYARSLYATVLYHGAQCLKALNIDISKVEASLQGILQHIAPDVYPTNNMPEGTIIKVATMPTVIRDFIQPLAESDPQRSEMFDYFSSFSDPLNQMAPGMAQNAEALNQVTRLHISRQPAEMQELLRLVYPEFGPADSVIDDGIDRSRPEFEALRKKLLSSAAMLYSIVATPDQGQTKDHIFSQVIAGTEIGKARAEFIKEKQQWTEEQVYSVKTAHFPPPSSQLRYALEVPLYEECPRKQATDLAGLGNVLHQLNSVAMAALKFEHPEQIEMILNVNNSSAEAKKTTDGKIVGTLGNERTLSLLQMIKDADLQPAEIVSRIDWIDRNAPEYPEMEQFVSDTINAVRSAMAGGMQINVIDCTDGMYIAKKVPQNQTIIPMGNLAAQRQLAGLAAQRRLRESKYPGGKFHFFLDGDCRIFPDGFNTLSESLAGSQSVPDVVLAPFHVLCESKLPAAKKEAADFNELAAGNHLLAMLESVAAEQERKVVKGSMMAFVSKLTSQTNGNEQTEDAAVHRAFDWGPAWKSGFVVSDAAYEKVGGWNGAKVDYREMGDGDQFYAGELMARRCSDFLVSDSAFAGIAFSVREVPTAASSTSNASRWENSVGIGLGNRLMQRFMEINLNEPAVDFSLSRVTRDGVFAEFVSGLFRRIQRNARIYNASETQLVEEFLGGDSVRYQFPNPVAGAEVMRNNTLEQIYAMIMIAMRLVQSPEIAKYPNLATIYSFIGNPLRESAIREPYLKNIRANLPA